MISELYCLQAGHMAHSAATRQLSIQDFIAELRKFQEPSFRRTDEILHFLESSPVSPESLAPYLTWNRQHYTRNLIDKTRLYELIAICWEAGQVSSVHNHRDQNCWMAMAYGKLQVHNFAVIKKQENGRFCELKPTVQFLIDPQHPTDTLAPLVHKLTTAFPHKSPDGAQECVQIVRAGSIETLSRSEWLHSTEAGTTRALSTRVSGGSVGRPNATSNPTFERRTGVQVRKLERVGSLNPGKPIRATARRRGPAARGSSR